MNDRHMVMSHFKIFYNTFEQQIIKHNIEKQFNYLLSVGFLYITI
jgi:hypothetical protein